MKTLAISIFLGCSLFSGLAQLPGSPDDTTNQLSVKLWVPGAKDIQNPASIDIQAYVQMQGQGLKAGDSVNVEFFANAKSVGSAKAVWHDMIRPHAAPGQAVPMWIMAAGFYPAKLTWKDVPAGNYSLIGRATSTNGLSAISPAVTVTVAPK